MSFAHRYIETAEKIIKAYDGSMPLQHFLKQFFAADKKYGSKDRKAISHACYCFYRLGKTKTDSISSQIKLGIFLCSDEPGIWRNEFTEDWIENWSNDLNARSTFAASISDVDDVFPFESELSETIDKSTFIRSHLIQPDLHLRIRPGKQNNVIAQLIKAEVPFTECGDTCIAVANGTKIDQLLQINKDVVVQDLSSQRVAEFLEEIPPKPMLKVWDCCAASGGKSILAYDHFKSIELTVSDVRATIIQNLKKRFAEAGIRNYRSFVSDLTISSQPSSVNYDLIICDAPCSGSGTWSRTPEQLSFFQKGKIDYYTDLQRKITSKIIPAVAKNGYLLYITCSVFKQENEDVVEHILQNSKLKLVRMDYLIGYDKKADTMFAALFTASAP
jgi:16S rRNA (cytosine967-C5)-methyltransferase